MRSLKLMFLAIVMLSSALLAQEPSQPTQPSPASGLRQPNDGLATVYLYRKDYDPFIYSFIFSRTMSVKFADAETASKDLPKIAKLRKDRYMILKLRPGSYLFDTREMDDKLKLDLKAGDERYLRFDQGYNCPSESEETKNIPHLTPTCEERRASIFEMSADDGRGELAKMKPIGKGDVKNRSLVIIPIK